MHTDPAGPRGERNRRKADGQHGGGRKNLRDSPDTVRPAGNALRTGTPPDRSSACNSIQEGQTADRPRAIPVVPTFGNRIPGRQDGFHSAGREKRQTPVHY